MDNRILIPNIEWVCPLAPPAAEAPAEAPGEIDGATALADVDGLGHLTVAALARHDLTTVAHIRQHMLTARRLTGLGGIGGAREKEVLEAIGHEPAAGDGPDLAAAWEWAIGQACEAAQRIVCTVHAIYSAATRHVELVDLRTVTPADGVPRLRVRWRVRYHTVDLIAGALVKEDPRFVRIPDDGRHRLELLPNPRTDRSATDPGDSRCLTP